MQENKYSSFDEISLWELLYQFWEHYVEFIDAKTNEKISISSDIPVKSTEENTYCFSLEDPFDIMHNPGDRPKQLGYIEKIHNKFKDAYMKMKDIMEKQNLQLLRELFLKE